MARSISESTGEMAVTGKARVHCDSSDTVTHLDQAINCQTQNEADLVVVFASGSTVCKRIPLRNP